MKQIKILLPILVVALLLVGCARVSEVGIAKYTGFTELPFPSNAYVSGQIVEIYSMQRKVEITFDPEIPWDQVTLSDGWKINATEIEDIKVTFSSEIKRILEGTAGYSADHKVIVAFDDTKTRIIPKYRISNALYSSIQTDPSLKDHLESYIDEGTHFDVITQTLSATISFTAVDNSNSELKIDSEVIRKLNSEFNLDFKHGASSNKVISGTNLVVGFHYDPKMIKILLNKINQ